MRLLFAAALLASLSVGCQSASSFEPYRTDLHKIDARIYDDYLAYVNEAEANKTRSPDVIWSNRRAVQQAESYYQSAAPTTRAAP